MEHPHFTLGQAIIDNTKVNEKYYSLSAEAQKNLGMTMLITLIILMNLLKEV